MMDKDGSREAAKPRRPLEEPHRSIFIGGLGALVVEAMETVLTLPDELRGAAEVSTLVKTVDGHDWRVKLEYIGFSGPDTHRGFAPLREEDGAAE